VVEARGVREPEEFKAPFYTVVENYAQPNHLAKPRRRGSRNRPKTVIKYVKYIQWAYLIFVVPLWQAAGSPRRIYLVSRARQGAENRKRSLPTPTEKSPRRRRGVYYLKEEVDFYYVGQERAVVEAAYDPDKSHIRKAAKAAEN